ncbi:hypothetical protein Dsin_018255 [Dipteronia sinensis]|uniref:RNase H type-1 domain-containing protein n=1 Tax=Dipteronia sinensis TaxID=43782 RepID=A0AAE0E2X6_9ROSI|nr:hypothetical protein Dsin_018255 [Dipteronia sinensis]
MGQLCRFIRTVGSQGLSPLKFYRRREGRILPVSADVEDKLCWHFTPVGGYSVKSGYKVGLMKESFDLPDAALDLGRNCVGLGIIIHDCFGEVMAVAAMRVNAGYSPLVAEAVALLRGMEFAWDTGLHPAVVESDALGVINQVNSGCEHTRMFPNLSDVGLVIQNICSRMSAGGFLDVQHVSRNVNQAAHTIAKLALMLDEDRVWLEDFSPQVESCILVDKPD